MKKNLSYFLATLVFLAPLSADSTFQDEQSGLIMQLPPHFVLNEEESDLGVLEVSGEGRWLIFNDGQNDDIALIIYRFDHSMTPEQFFLHYMLEEFEDRLPAHLRLLFGRPAIQTLKKADHPITKIEYPVVTANFESLNADYFFTHGKHGFSIWISPRNNDAVDLEALEGQIEAMLDTLQFTK